MSAFTGPQRKGAMRDYRESKRLDAIDRHSRTQPQDRRADRCPDLCGHQTHTRPSRHAQREATS